LNVSSEEELQKLYQKLLDNQVKVSAFTETDMNDSLTSISFVGDEYSRKLVSSLPLAGKEVSRG